MQPLHGLGAVAHQRLGEVGIAVLLRDAAEVVEILLGRVFAEVGVLDLAFGQVGHHAFHVVQAVVTMRKPPPV